MEVLRNYIPHFGIQQLKVFTFTLFNLILRIRDTVLNVFQRLGQLFSKEKMIEGSNISYQKDEEGGKEITESSNIPSEEMIEGSKRNYEKSLCFFYPSSEKGRIEGSSIFYTKDFFNSEKEIKKFDGRITHRFSINVIVVNFSNSVDVKELKYTFIDYDCLQRELDEDEQSLIKAWYSINEDSGKRFERDLAPPKSGRIPPATSRYMIGKIAINIIIVSGLHQCEYSKDEENKTLQEILKSTDFLANAEPRAQITFIYKLHRPKVTVKPGATGFNLDKYEKLESPWRDAALKELHCFEGYQGINKLTKQLRDESGSDWAFTAFFTKYEIACYAYSAQQHLVMEYKNGNFGPDNIHIIFAHEVCHIFGAKDEYTGHNGDPSGTLRIDNGNAQDCGGREKCLMQDEELIGLCLCEFTRGQIGWFWDLCGGQCNNARRALLNNQNPTPADLYILEQIAS
ncbi:hypothetical protein RclHR1_01890004 [Rhizophagus clarus]|uniref:Uncharacterized protein n=1 Tax=Rhizophagus clarus TaxID=94130 RepID=A0A2Z6QNB6_9GLOM|nr:hypothetical protein RclHR1_01890004 [Rhizophagus clarus]GES85529.1 hypothetical protein RCL2_001263400 [Rhizophagus clarus]